MFLFNFHCCKNYASSIVTHFSHIPELFSKVIVQFTAVVKNVVDFRFLCTLWKVLFYSFLIFASLKNLKDIAVILILIILITREFEYFFMFIVFIPLDIAYLSCCFYSILDRTSFISVYRSSLFLNSNICSILVLQVSSSLWLLFIFKMFLNEQKFSFNIVELKITIFLLHVLIKKLFYILLS